MNLFSKTLVVALVSSTCAWAGPEHLQRDTPVSFAIIDQELVSVLEEFGSSAGIPMTIDRRVSGRVSNFNAKLSARGFLDQIAADHGLTWYFDGSTIHVTPAAANGSVVIDFGQVTAERLNATLEEMGVADPRFALRQTGNTGIGIVSGPPRYVEMVENAFLMLANRTTRPPAKAVAAKRITVIRGEQVEVWSGPARISAIDTAPQVSQPAAPAATNTPSQDVNPASDG